MYFDIDSGTLIQHILKAVGFILPKILLLLTVEKILRGEAEHETHAEALFDEGFEIMLVAQRNGLVEVRFQRGAAAGNGGSEARVDTRHILDETGIVNMMRLVVETTHLARERVRRLAVENGEVGEGAGIGPDIGSASGRERGGQYV